MSLLLRKAAALAVSAAACATLASAASSSLNRTDWQAEALITDPTEECTSYDYAPVDDVISSYPTIWESATVSFSGVLAADAAIFAAMNSSIPDIASRGTRDGTWNAAAEAYNTTSDPDCWWTDTLCTTPKLAGLPDDVTSCPEPNTWGFTLDDGPNCSHNAYYDYLNSIEQKATLFYIGSNVADWPLEGQRGLADGHEICAHTWSHPYMTALSNEEAFAELYYSKKIIHDVLGITVTCWRPPFGDVDDRIRYIANQLGLRTIIWTHDTDDWDYAAVGVSTIESNYESIINGTYDTEGIIVLTHEIDNETMVLSEKYLPQIIEKFTGGVMPVGVCRNVTQPYGEGAAYQYPNYAQWVAGTRSISVAAPTAYSSEIAMATGSAVSSAGLPASSAAAAGTTATGKSSSSSKKTESATASTASASGSSVAGSSDAATAGAEGSLRGSVALLAGVALGALAIFV